MVLSSMPTILLKLRELERCMPEIFRGQKAVSSILA